MKVGSTFEITCFSFPAAVSQERLSSRDEKRKISPRSSLEGRAGSRRILTAVPVLSRCSAAAAQSPQSCPTLCDPRDGSPPGSPVPGILQARTLEWAATSFSKGSIKTFFSKEFVLTLPCYTHSDTQLHPVGIAPFIKDAQGTSETCMESLASPLSSNLTSISSSLIWV